MTMALQTDGPGGWPRRVVALGLLLLAGWMPAAERPPAGRAYQIDTWDTDDGLPQNSVTAICQTRDGYLWLGTHNGLARFDGVRFKMFSPDTLPALSGNRITCLWEDSGRRLWFGVEGGGVSRLEAGQFDVPNKLRIPDNTVTCIAEGRSGAMWFGTVRGEIILHAGGLVRFFDRGDGLPGHALRALVMDAEGVLWAATDDWLGTLGKGRFERHPWAATGAMALAARQQGGVWLAGKTGLAQLTRAAGQWRSRFSAEGGVQTLLEDRNGVVWIGLNSGGLLRVEEGQWKSISAKDGMGTDPVLALGEDTEGNLWAGLQNGGLCRLKRRVIDVLDKRNGLAPDNILSVCEDACGGVWLGTDAGLHLVQPGGEIQRFGAEHGLTNEHITAVWEDRQRTLWVGTWGGGLFHRRGTHFESGGDKPELDGKFIRSIHEDAQGNLWIGTRLNGAYCLGESGLKKYDPGTGLAHSDVQAIWRDRAGAVWFGTGGGGLSCLREGTISTFTTAHGLPSDFVRVIFEDEEGTLWVGTSGGLARLRNGQIVPLRTAQGLPGNAISQIFKDRRGTFWFGSNRGIFRVPARELRRVADGEIPRVRCFTYTKTDGLGGRECNGGFQPAGCQTRDGRLWFPTPKGVAIVEPDNLRLNARPPRVMIEEVLADEKLLTAENPPVEPDNSGLGELAHEPPPAGRVHVSPNCQRLEIRYTGINFSAPRRVQFKYRLANHDPDWVEAGAERVAVYLRPPPGRYLFQVRAVTSDGVWNEIGSALAVTVATPLWRAWWFLTLTAAGATGLGVYVIRLVSRRNMQRVIAGLEQQQALATERARIAADMHDQLGSRLTQISLLGELAQREAASPETVARQLDKITLQSREVAKSLDEIVWTVNPGNDTLERTAAYIVHFADEFFEPTAIRCRLDVPASLPECALSAERRHHLFLAFKEALTNVARHAVATEVEVRLATSPELMSLSIRDNGRGFSGSASGGHGLDNMRARIEVIGGRFELSSQPGGGTCLTFHIPMTPPATTGHPRADVLPAGHTHE